MRRRLAFLREELRDVRCLTAILTCIEGRGGPALLLPLAVLLGVLGTILAIGAALQQPAEALGGSSGVEVIVSRFGEAIWSTFAGLVAGILLMFVNSLVEPAFLRLSENRLHVREMVSRVKHELILAGGRESQ